LLNNIILEKQAKSKDRFIKETLTCLVLLYAFFLLYLLSIFDVISIL